MYIQKHFEESRLSVLHALIKAQPLGAWVSLCGTELVANHMPFLIDADRGEFGTLMAHAPRANPIWQSCSKDRASMVIFQGAQAYISPSWYPSKHAHGKAVPTWNYAVVHVHGIPQAIEDREWLLNHVTRLSRDHESKQARPWSVSDAPKEYIDKMLEAIVGIEIPILKIEGKWKLNQNRPGADRLGVVAGLQARDNADSMGMADLMKSYLDL